MDHVYNWVGYSTSDNDQVKPAGKDYVLLQCCNKQKSKKTQKFHVSKTPTEHYQIVIKFKIIRYGNIYNVILMSICIELSEMRSFIVNMPENARYLK